MKYLTTLSLRLNLSDITILLISTEFISIGYLKVWNSVLSTSSNFKVIPLIFILHKKINKFFFAAS